MSMQDYSRFANLGFDDFRRLAADSSKSQFEKIGFPDAYRQGKEPIIFQDICHKLLNLGRRNQTVLDIGPGCSDLPRLMIDLCEQQGHTLVLVDSAEMLAHLPDAPFLTKVAARYPQECLWLFEKYARAVDVILTYSVLHYIFAEGNLFDFLDRSLALLADGGELLLGDIPNISKRKRFFSSPRGIEFHQNFTGTDEIPEMKFNQLEMGAIDDSVIASILLRSRGAGFDAYWLPQADELPMANRREDVLITKP